MDLEEEEAITGTVSLLEVEGAVVDAINVYLRDVLQPRGIIDAYADAGYPDHAGTERNALKYRIAERAALRCLGAVPDMEWRKR